MSTRVCVCVQGLAAAAQSFDKSAIAYDTKCRRVLGTIGRAHREVRRARREGGITRDLSNISARAIGGASSCLAGFWELLSRLRQ
jgi:hypothetical protein